MPVVDLSGCSEAEQRARKRGGWRARRRSGRLSLSSGPLLRVRLLRLGAEEHVVLLTMHHIVADGWSMGVLVREVAELYEALRRGAGVSRWRSCRFSMRTMRCGSESGCRSGAGGAAEYWREQLARSAGGAGVADGPAAAGGAELSRGAVQRLGVDVRS